ncbi:hypothetical protein PBAL39_00532 [Pedobacter sp. BAL39]|uniref:hypothetical protein n=1 Tax=Pedobacter sp. BAL39 TaxID=391596 RepID=UPI0001559A8C|nr:hypothetical protein [Pedobacter sp. BAL39]EDM38055.1 hypothetical protein PBAL39_00532 [Pedobacter sp. BAL39]
MENNQENQLQEEEIPTLEQFQVGRNAEADDNQEEGGETAGYTSDEVEFADGEGTQLDDEIDGPEDDDDFSDDDDLSDDDDDDALVAGEDEAGTSEDDDDADFENPAPEDDPA